MCAYNPGVAFDARPIFQGISGGAADIASAMVAKKRKDEEDRDFLAKSRATESFLKQNGDAIGLDPEQVKALIAPSPDETPRSRAIRLGDTLANGFTATTVKRHLAQQKKEDADRAAFSRAFTGPDGGQDPLGNYAAAGGSDPHMVSALVPLAKQLAQGARPKPGLGDFGRDAFGRPVQGLVDAQGNVRYIEPPKEEKDKLTPLEIGGRKLFVGPGNRYFDETGAPVAFPANIDPTMLAVMGEFFGGKKGGTGPSAPAVEPPEGARRALLANPALAAEFDKKYGAGASARYLKQ